MVDDDVPLSDVGHAVLVPSILSESITDDGDLPIADEPGKLLPQEDLGVGILVDLVALGDRLDQFEMAS